ncbi:MAG TPA: restriction endonuclease subunit S [Gallionellaceae bacterium]|nr:restriction endonuclease subunit S [Gallionellaceae bacterium]
MPEAITDNLDLWSSVLLTKSTAGRGSNNKLEAYGIKKLRELILELAIHGKLVPQDANDEPASVLLENIAKEKARLIKEGVIKNEKDLLPISNEEIPFDLPGEWVWQRLGEIGFTQTGGTPSKTNKEYFGNDIPFLKPGDIYPGYVDYENEGLSNEGAKALGRTAPAGSILMVCIGTIGKCNIIERTCAFNQQINSITPYMEMSSYLLNALGSVYFQKTAWEMSSSTTIAILNKGKWVDIVVPIPPLEEQHRIVAKVDELMALCDQLEQQQTHSIESHQTLVASLLGTLTRVESQQKFSAAWARIASHFDILFTTEASIDQLKQTILQLAVMGKLVPQDLNDEPASTLLKRIKAEKAKLVAEGKSKKDKPLPPITEDEEPFELPKMWEWVRLGDLATQITDGAHHTPEYISDGVPFLSVKNLSSGYLDFTDTRFISPAAHAELTKRCNPELDDILLTKIGTTGIAVVIDDPRPFSIFVSVALIKLPKVLIDRDYLSLVINSPFVRQQSEDGTEGVGNKNLVLRKINTFDIPLAPLAEQQRIVAKVEELMALCDALKERFADAQTTQHHLADAIVEQAVA